MRKAISSLVAAATFTLGACSPGESGDSNSSSFGAPTTGGESMGSMTSSSPTGDTTVGGGSGVLDGDTGLKFDVEWSDQPGFDTDGPGPGSCRSSEIYGASGGFPVFADPAYSPFLDRKIAIVTHNVQGQAPNYVLTIFDIDGPPPPPNMNYAAPRYNAPTWTMETLGPIFGLTLDSDGNIYVAPTSVYYTTPPQPGTIKRIDRVTGAISDFATLPNNGPAIGNINYDCVSETIYASNHEDGRIYQIEMSGAIRSTFHHGTMSVTMGAANDAGEPNGQFAPLGERPWAVQSHAGRLYYSLWVEHSFGSNPARENEVWSVAYADDTGVPDPTTAKYEFSLPANSPPVSDISFAHTGWMLVAQRTMNGDNSTGAHQSTTFEYDYEGGTWVSQGTTYIVGELLPYSAAGGVDHDFKPDGYVWMTGDALDFYTPNVVYGLQGTPYGGGGIEVSTLIDVDGEITNQDKTTLGDVELPIPGDVAPVPPPVG
jgi:hypothetical protein